jgi:hypothetical protein
LIAWFDRASERVQRGLTARSAVEAASLNLKWCDLSTLDNYILLRGFHHGVIHKRGWIDTFDGITYTVWKPDGELLGST